MRRQWYMPVVSWQQRHQMADVYFDMPSSALMIWKSPQKVKSIGCTRLPAGSSTVSGGPLARSL